MQTDVCTPRLEEDNMQTMAETAIKQPTPKKGDKDKQRGNRKQAKGDNTPVKTPTKTPTKTTTKTPTKATTKTPTKTTTKTPAKTVEEWLAKDKAEYEAYESFYKFHVSRDGKKFLFEIPKGNPKT